MVRRRYPGSATVPIAPHRWRFAMVQGNATLPGRGGDVTGAEQGIVASPRHIYLPEGFEPGWIYELTYTAQDPAGAGFGLPGGARGGHVSPQRRRQQPAARAKSIAPIVRGRSQSGRAIRDFLHRGFNAAPGGGRVFDGMLPHISGGGKTAMNRFSNLVVAASRQYEDQLNPSDRFPFSYASSRDPSDGRGRRHPHPAGHRSFGDPYADGE